MTRDPSDLDTSDSRLSLTDCESTDSQSVTADLQLTGDELLETFPAGEDLTDHVTVTRLPPTAARTVAVDDVLRPALARPYPYEPFVHQAQALEALGNGHNVCVTTSTSSGKTDIYGLQIARNQLDCNDAVRESTAYVIYPMKALARDQQTELEGLYDTLSLDIDVGVYDGDTERGETRRRIRDEADVIISNFMGVNTYLHNHDKWARFFRACDLIVVDESHTYTGIQGMHVAWIIRRLKRVIDYYGGDPQFVLTSATIGNPQPHSEALVDEPVTVIDDDGSPQGARELVLWNPRPSARIDPDDDEDVGPQFVEEGDEVDQHSDEPAREATDETATDENGKETNDTTVNTIHESVSSDANQDERRDHDDGIIDRLPASIEAPRVFSHLTYHGLQTLLFCPSRKLSELSIERARSHRTGANRHRYSDQTGLKYEPYHAGLGKRTRHSVEQQFKRGAIDGVASTSALELGINVGDIDATIMMGYPGQRQRFWQRIGRAGRDGATSLSVLVADYRTLDQYVITHPEYLLEQDVEDAVVDTSNDAVFARHLLCAADELAISEADVGSFGSRDRVERAIEMWRRAGRVSGMLETGVAYTGPPRPQTDVSLYATTETRYAVRLADGISDDLAPDLEPIAQERVFRDYHEGAVRVHGGHQYEVIEVVHDAPTPYIVIDHVDVDYFTRSMREVTILDATAERTRKINGFSLHVGTGTILVHHAHYSKQHVETNEVIEPLIPTALPPLQMHTQLCWIEVPDAVERPLCHKYTEYRSPDLDEEENEFTHIGYLGGLHAAEHAMIKTAPLELLVDTADLGGLSTLLVDGHLADGAQIDGATGPGSVDAVERLMAAQMEAGALSHSSSGWFIYDSVEGGLGFARTIFDEFERLAERTREQLLSCGCGRTEGCPACTMDSQCGNDNAPLHRQAALDVFDQLLGYQDPTALERDQPTDDRIDDRRPPLFYS